MNVIERLEELRKSTGYPITQQNGQRKFGPRLDWEGPPPPKGCEVFIGKLPRELFEDELVPLFSSVGTIYELRMMLNFSGSNRGFAFLNYNTVAEATAAIKLLHNYEIRPGHRIGVTRSADNCFLYIRGIPKDKTGEEVLVEISKYIEGVVNVMLPKDPLNESLNAGYVYVEFKSHRAAAMARRILVPGFVHFFGRELYVDWAELESSDKIYDKKQIKGLNQTNYQNVRLQRNTSAEEMIQHSSIFLLDKFCGQNNWQPPEYHFKRNFTLEGEEYWICALDLGLKRHKLKRVYSQPCQTFHEAKQEVAQKCLNFIMQAIHQMNMQQNPILSNTSYMPHTSQLYTTLCNRIQCL